MTTPDYADWTTPTGLVLQSGFVINQQYMNPGTTTPAADVSKYQSVSLVITLPTGGPSADRFSVYASFSDPGGIVQGTEWVSFHHSENYFTQPNFIVLVMPCVGSLITLGLLASGGIPVQVLVSGSTRAVPRSRMILAGPAITPLVAHQGTLGVAAGATGATIYIPPVDRALSLYLGTCPPACTYRVRAVYEVANPPTQDILGDWVGNNAAQTVNDLIIPRTALEVAFINNDTVLRNEYVNAWDVS